MEYPTPAVALSTETGLTPKEALRVTRFNRVRRRLRPWSGLAQAAAEGGYYDQAHLAREFRDLRRLLAERVAGDRVRKRPSQAHHRGCTVGS